MCPARSMSFTRHNRISQGYILTVQYIASLQMWGSGALPTQNGRHRRNPYACRFPYGIDATAGLTIHDKISDTIWQIFAHLFAGALQTWIRNPAPDQRCPHRWSAHRRDTWQPIVYEPQSHSLQAEHQRRSATDGEYQRNPADSPDSGFRWCYHCVRWDGQALLAGFLFWGILHNPQDDFDNIVDVGKISPALAEVEDPNRLISAQLIGKAKVDHVRAGGR